MDELHTGHQGSYPLSMSQKNIWDVERACPDTSINLICTSLCIRGRMDLPALQRSVQLVLEADPSLRTRIFMDGQTPMQYQSPFQPEPIPVYDYSQTDGDGVLRWEESFARETIPLLDSPLYRFAILRTGESSGRLLVKMHHLISDGWTQVLLCNRISQCYLDLLSGKEPDLGAIPGYERHLAEEERYLTSSACERDKSFWTEALERAGEPAALKSMRGAAVSPVGCRMTFDLPEDLNHDIYAFCMDHRVAPFSVFYMALAIYFKHIGGADRFTIGVPIFNRSNFTAKQTSGMFVSTLPFFSEVSGDWSLNEFSDHLNGEWFEMLRHQRFPFSQIQKLAEGRPELSDRLFHIAFSYQNSQLNESRDASVSFSGRWHYSGYQLEQLCIHLSNLEDNRRYCVDYDYLTQLFSAREIETLHSCLVNILRSALASPDLPIRQLAILTPVEREEVVYTFNRSAQPIFDTGLYDRFLNHVAQHPEKSALICGGQHTTYAQLEENCARVHAALSGICAAPETLVAVLLPRTPDLFAAMMGVLRAGGAFLLLSPSQPENRIREILSRSGAAVLLTTPQLGGGLADLLPVIHMECLPSPIQQPPASYRPEGLAYVVYTSGSTGAPKGVEINCASLLNLACAMKDVYGRGAVLSVCSVGFDAFLLESACAVLNGRTVLLPRDEELESPAALAGSICRHDVGFLSTTPSRVSAFLKDEDFRRAAAGLDSIVCGGEAFPGDLLQTLQQVTSARIYNQYGPSETTVAVSTKLLNGADAITAGSPMENCKLYVLDSWGNPLPAGVYGDLYVGGVCVGRGYRNAPELTAQSFSDSPFVVGDRLYRTGDIARWTADGEIVLAGRSDRQVKLRGLRVEPQEVADCLARHPGVRQAAAAVQRHSGQDVLLAFYTSDAPIGEEELLSLCASYLPHYMIPSAILRLEAIPLTPNGKVNEAILPHPDLTVSTQLSPRTRIQEQLLSIFRRVLGRPDLGVDSDYFLFGGNSLNAMEALSAIADQTGKSLRVSDLYTCRNVLRLSSLLERQADAVPAAHLTAAPPQERWPLTPIQQGIYVQSHLDPTGRTYHMAGAFRLSFAPDVRRLERAFRTLIAQEPLLRTVFAPESDGIFARVRPEADFVLPVFRGGSLDEASAELLAPFQLDCAPLLRAALWEEHPGSWVLLLNIHHIIGDGLTTPILLSRLDGLYRGQAPEAQPLNYLDYAWHLAQKVQEAERLDYWTGRLANLPEPLELPGDFPRPHTFDFRGGSVSLVISPELSARCDTFCAQKGISPYMLFLAAFGVLLSRLSGKEDVLVGAAAAGRLLPETRSMCGPFINTLPLRLTPTAGQTPDDYLSAVRAEVNGMLDHQQVGLEEIVSALGLKRSLSQSPLYQVIFSQRPLDAAGFSLDGKPLEYLPLSTGTARMDLWVELAREGDRYSFHMEYAKQLFLEETVAYFGRCLETIAASLVEDKANALSGLEALSARDRMELIDMLNHMACPFLNLPIPTQFARHLALDPDAPAVIFHGVTTSRRELDRRACQLANLLADAGAKPGCKVGIALSRTMDLVAAVLAIWKVGGAYAPLLAHYPEQRLAYMVEVADISHILCDEKTRAQLPDSLPCSYVLSSGEAADTFAAAPLKEDDLAEVLFTSGSTGRPKGVMIKWRSLANMAGGFREILERSDGPILCTTNVVFDMFNGEVVIPLSMGKPIVMADEEEMMLPWKLAELIKAHNIRITQSTPSRVQMWFSNEVFCQAAANLDMMIYGGEVLTETLLRQAQTNSNEALQVNMYGPTEGTVYTTAGFCDYRRHVTVGPPMRNVRVYVLDEQQRPVLPTAVGELYLAGENISAGYINRPDLTEAAYFPDPFFPGQTMYRIGDIGRLRLDGTYDFLGRRDAQVKLNGQRVELDEINGAFVSQGCALQAATVPVRREDGSMDLFTYYIPAPDHPDDREIRARLGKILPVYMLPSRMIPLDSMPSTPTGKISLRELKEMAEAGGLPDSKPDAAPAATPAAVQEEEAPAGSLEWILSLWRKVLNRPDVSPEVSFFEQGGTSLAALSVLSHYNNSKLSISLAQFYELPTAAGQAALFCPESGERPAPPPPAPVQTILVSSNPESVYPSRVPDLTDPVPMALDKPALLTGATGFLGAHLLRALLEAGVGKVVCTMRDGSRERLLDTLSWYFGSGWTAALDGQVEVIDADISKADLGLSSGDYQSLCDRIGSVWNCAADVRHYAADSEALLATNLEGTRQVIRLAQAAGVPLYHMSTTSVSGNRLVGRNDPARFTEHDFHMGQDWRQNLYVRSKFLAEDAVFAAVREGLTARVFRLGRLVGRAQDGTFQKNANTNAFWLTMRGIHALGAIPAAMADMPMELTPIDWCAQAAVALRDGPLTVYHLQNPSPSSALEVSRAVVPELRVLPNEAFEHLLAHAPVDAAGDLLAPLLNLWNQQKAAPATILVDCSHTTVQLERAGFRTAIPGPERLLRAFRFSPDERIEKEALRL